MISGTHQAARAAIELGDNYYVITTGTINGGSTGTAASPSGNTSAETIFVRRAFTYLGSDQRGLVRLGQTDGVIGLFDNCIFTSQCWDAGIGAFNAGAMQAEAPGGATSIPFVRWH